MKSRIPVTELRKTGISVVGTLPWGTHFCHFYETQQDLLDTLVLYFKAGLENKEFCLWVVSRPLTVEEASALCGRLFLILITILRKEISKSIATTSGTPQRTVRSATSTRGLARKT